MRKAIVAMLLAVLALSGLSAALGAEEKKNKTQGSDLELLHKIDALEKLNEHIDELKLMVESISRKKYSDCLKAFGNPKFCQCLKDNSPVGINFSEYIQIVITPKDELGYSKAKKEDRELIDSTLKAREACGKR